MVREEKREVPREVMVVWTKEQGEFKHTEMVIASPGWGVANSPDGEGHKSTAGSRKATSLCHCAQGMCTGAMWEVRRLRALPSGHRIILRITPPAPKQVLFLWYRTQAIPPSGVGCKSPHSLHRVPQKEALVISLCYFTTKYNTFNNILTKMAGLRNYKLTSSHGDC